MIYNMEKLDRVISKIVTDLGLGQNDIPYADFVEWIADGLQHIGAYPQFQNKPGLILIEDYEGFIPCDVYNVIKMEKGTEIKCTTTGGFYDGTLADMMNKAGVDYDAQSAYDRFKTIAVPGISKIDNNLDYSGLTNHLNNNPNLIGNPSMIQHTSTDYSVNFNKITTGFKDGFIEIQYQAFPVDERGWPLVPDNVSFRDALFWKVASQLSMRDPSLFKNPRLQDYEYCRSKWNFYCVQARAGANMPNLEQMQGLANNFTRLHNTIDDYSNNFKDLGKPQRLNLDGRR